MTLHEDDAPECVELLWTLADPDPPPFDSEDGPLIDWYRTQGHDYGGAAG